MYFFTASSDASAVGPDRMSTAHQVDMTIRYVELDFTEKICSRLAWRGLGKLQILVWVPLSDSQPDVTPTTTSGQKGYYRLTWGQISRSTADLLNSRWTWRSLAAHGGSSDVERDWSRTHNAKTVNVTRACVASTDWVHPRHSLAPPPSRLNACENRGHCLNPLGLILIKRPLTDYDNVSGRHDEGGIILARTMALLVNPVHWRDKCVKWASSHARWLVKRSDGCREKHRGKQQERPLRGCRQASECPRYDDDKWDCKLMRLTRRTYLLLCVLMSHYALMDIKYPPPPQNNQQEIHVKVKREENAIGIWYKIYFSLEFYKHAKQNVGKSDLDLLDPSVKLNKKRTCTKQFS